jgi:hypothetical protein
MWYCVFRKLVPDVSKDHSALIVSVKHFLRLPNSKEETSGATRLTKQCHIPEESNLRQHHCQKFKSRSVGLLNNYQMQDTRISHSKLVSSILECKMMIINLDV